MSNTNACCCRGLQSNMPYELDAASLNTFGECDMNGQLQTPVLAAHYRVMPGRQQLQPSNGNGKAHANSNGNGKAHANGNGRAPANMLHSPVGRTLVGFSFNTKFGSGAEMIFYEFAGSGALLGPCCTQRGCWC